MYKSFNIVGEVFPVGSMFNATLTLSTPDGKTTTMESGAIFKTEDEAKAYMHDGLSATLKDFKSQGVEVLSVNGETVQ